MSDAKEFFSGLWNDVQKSATAYAAGQLSQIPKTVASDGSQHTAGQIQPVVATGTTTASTSSESSQQGMDATTVVIVVLLAIAAVGVVAYVAKG